MTAAIQHQSGRRPRRGSAVITALGALLVASMVGLSTLVVSGTSVQSARHRAAHQTAFDLAEAGVGHAVLKLMKDPAYPGQGWTAYGEGSFRVEVTRPSGTGAIYRLVTSTGRIDTGRRVISRSVQATVSFQSRIWEYGVITEKALSLGGQFRADSSPTAGEGNVHSNSVLTAGSGVVVDGRASAVGTVTSSGIVTGGTYSGATPVEFPKIDSTGIRLKAATIGTTVGDVSFNSGYRTIGGILQGNLELTGTAVLNVDRILWVTGTVKLAGSAYLGNGLLICEKEVTLTGGSGFNGSETNSLAIVTLSSSKKAALHIGGQSIVRGGLYAPNGSAEFAGQARVYGSLAARDLIGGGQAHITRIQGFAAPEELADPSVRYWKEL